MADAEQRDKKELADALQALSEGAAPSDMLRETRDEEEEILAEGFEFDPVSRRSFRPLIPETGKAEPRPGSPTDSLPPPAIAASSVAESKIEKSKLEVEADFDDIIEGNDVEVHIPAPTSEMLVSPARILGTNRARAPKYPSSMSMQRTMIPILLTLAALCAGMGTWILTLPAESQMRSIDPRLHLYLFAAAPVFALIAAVNMLQVRAGLLKHHARSTSSPAR